MKGLNEYVCLCLCACECVCLKGEQMSVCVTLCMGLDFSV